MSSMQRYEGLVGMGFWLATGFALFAFVMGMVRRVQAKARSSAPVNPKSDYRN